jgi:predicted O-methyltransferase YrrM
MNGWLQKAKNLASVGDNDGLLALFNDLLSDPANKADVLGHRAWLYFSTRKFDLALKDYEELASVSDPDDYDTMFHIAECFVEMGRTDEARPIVIRLTQENIHDRRLLYLILRIQNISIDRETYFDHIKEFSPNPMLQVMSSTNVYFPGPINRHIGLFIYSLIRNVRPAFAMEIGSYVGVSAIYMAQGLKDNGLGHLYCFDLFDQTLPNISGNATNQHDLFNEYIRCAGLSEYVTAFAGDSSSLAESVDIEAKQDDPSVIFIDGDHTLKGVLKDFNAIRRYINKDSIILLHDVNHHHTSWAGPALLVKELCRQGEYNITIMPTNDHTDLAIIQCKSSDAVQSIKPTFTDIMLHKLYFLMGRR